MLNARTFQQPQPAPLADEGPRIVPFPGSAVGRARFVTVADLFAEFLERTKSSQGAKTYLERKRLLEAFAAVNGHLRIAELIPDDLEKWIENNQQWASDWTLLRVAGSIKRPFNWALRKGLINRNPFIGVSFPAGKRGEPMSEAHFRLLLRNAEAGLRRVLLFLSWTGARPCEVAGLTWGSLDCEAGTATLTVHKTVRTRKDRAPRIIYLPGQAVRLLAYLARCRKTSQDCVFVHSRGKPWIAGGLALRIWRLRKRLGIPPAAKLYGLRHAWATRLASAGVELKTLSTLLGHTTSRMSEHYIHVAGQTVRLRSELQRGIGGQK